MIGWSSSGKASLQSSSQLARRSAPFVAEVAERVLVELAVDLVVEHAELQVALARRSTARTGSFRFDRVLLAVLLDLFQMRWKLPRLKFAAGPVAEVLTAAGSWPPESIDGHPERAELALVGLVRGRRC